MILDIGKSLREKFKKKKKKICVSFTREFMLESMRCFFFGLLGRQRWSVFSFSVMSSFPALFFFYILIVCIITSCTVHDMEWSTILGPSHACENIWRRPAGSGYSIYMCAIVYMVRQLYCSHAYFCEGFIYYQQQ